MILKSDRYGFAKIGKARGKQKDPVSGWTFHHDEFVRGRPDRFINIRRRIGIGEASGDNIPRLNAKDRSRPTVASSSRSSPARSTLTNSSPIPPPMLRATPSIYRPTMTESRSRSVTFEPVSAKVEMEIPAPPPKSTYPLNPIPSSTVPSDSNHPMGHDNDPIIPVPIISISRHQQSLRRAADPTSSDIDRTLGGRLGASTNTRFRDSEFEKMKLELKETKRRQEALVTLVENLCGVIQRNIPGQCELPGPSL